MDYSLLLGIHDHRKEQNYRALTTGASATSDGFEIVTRGSRHPSLSSPREAKDQRSFSSEESFIPAGVYPWFRQDFGGLRSYTPRHPIHNHEEVNFPSTYDDKSFSIISL